MTPKEKKLMEKFSKLVMDITMPDGSTWRVPVLVIARHRAKFYAETYEEFGGDEIRSLLEDTLPYFAEDSYKIKEWAADNMNWEDIAVSAYPIQKNSENDFQEGLVNGHKEIVEIEE